MVKWKMPNWALIAPEKEVKIIDTMDISIEGDDMKTRGMILSDIREKTQERMKDYDEADVAVLQTIMEFDDNEYRAIVDVVKYIDEDE